MAEAKALAWLNDGKAVKAWLKDPERHLRKRLESESLVKIPQLLPPFVAEGLLRRLQRLSADCWDRAGEGAREDVGYEDRVQHRFGIADVEGDALLLGGARVLAPGRQRASPMWCVLGKAQMLPGTLPNFSAACYQGQDHIAPHTDEVPEEYSTEDSFQEVSELKRAYAAGSSTVAAARWAAHTPAEERLQEALRSGDLQAVRAASAGTERRPWRRWVAAAYYLNKDWKASFGGRFIDMADGKESQTDLAPPAPGPPSLPPCSRHPRGIQEQRHLPEFNTLVAFEVPHLHAVEKVKKGQKRYSIFGWWLVEDAPKRPAALKRPAAMKRPAAAAKRPKKGRAEELRQGRLEGWRNSLWTPLLERCVGTEPHSTWNRYALDASHGWAKAAELLALARQHGAIPSSYMLNLALRAAALGAAWQVAVDMLAEATFAPGRHAARSQEANVISFNTTAKALATAKQWAQCLALLGAQRDAQIPMDIVSFNTLQHALAGGSCWQLALSSLHAAQRCQLRCDDASYSATIVACGRSSRLWHVLQLARQSRELSSNLDIQRAEEYWSFTCLFQALSTARAHRWRQTLQLLAGRTAALKATMAARKGSELWPLLLLGAKRALQEKSTEEVAAAEVEEQFGEENGGIDKTWRSEAHLDQTSGYLQRCLAKASRAALERCRSAVTRPAASVFPLGIESTFVLNLGPLRARDVWEERRVQEDSVSPDAMADEQRTFEGDDSGGFPDGAPLAGTHTWQKPQGDKQHENFRYNNVRFLQEQNKDATKALDRVEEERDEAFAAIAQWEDRPRSDGDGDGGGSLDGERKEEWKEEVEVIRVRVWRMKHSDEALG
eukprot:g9819.t1